jgi:hypothetical protein
VAAQPVETKDRLVKLYNKYLVDVSQRQPEVAALLTVAHILEENFEKFKVMTVDEGKVECGK